MHGYKKLHVALTKMKILKAKLFILPFGIDGLTSFFFLVWWVYMHQIALKKGQLMSATRLDIVPSTTKILLLVLPVYFSFLTVRCVSIT